MKDILTYPERTRWTEICSRPGTNREAVSKSVSDTMARIREGGDAALRELTLQYDGATTESLIVTLPEFDAANNQVDNGLKAAIDIAVSNIEKFHSVQRPQNVETETCEGVRCYQKSLPIKRIGLYIPGGTAPLFSTVLMLVIPAKIAGCSDITLFTPPFKDGSVSPVILYVAQLLGITEVVRAGGAQAIAAMAFGTESIRKVDKIFGPGNSYVAEAKLQVSNFVSIDMIAGPSELMIIADNTANPSFIAADLLSQAEHGPDSQLFLLTSERELADRVMLQLAIQLDNLPRKEIAAMALLNSKIVMLRNEEEMIDFANLYGAEHLMISTEDPWSIADKIESAGSIFLGSFSPESAGDYASGTNHSLPTNGWTKSVSGISVESFLHKISYQEISTNGLQAIGPAVETMAEAEGLFAHKNAVTIRLKEIQNGL
ncbi:MAG: histidinol dehydrogenase [Bacteroidetes bacterium GWF2_40_14]|nr:MAG: histidinol dehydrogenase [Bacteroidetes bacterium GWF2_40_14]